MIHGGPDLVTSQIEPAASALHVAGELLRLHTENIKVVIPEMVRRRKWSLRMKEGKMKDSVIYYFSNLCWCHLEEWIKILTSTWGQQELFCMSIMGWNYVSVLCMSASAVSVTARTTFKLYNWINYTKFWWREKMSHSILMPENPSRSRAFTYSSLYCILTGRDTFLHINTSSL